MMENQKLQEQMFQSMFRLRRFNMGSVLHDISGGEYKILEILGGCPGKEEESKGIYVSKMASVMKVSPPAVSRMLKSMEHKEYIGRTVDSKDRRNTCVFITEKGKEKREECRKILLDFMNRVIERMNPDSMQQMLDLFNRMLDIMEDEMKKTEKGDRIC